MTGNAINVADLAKEWMKDPEFKAEYDALEKEFSLAAAHKERHPKREIFDVRSQASHASSHSDFE